MAFVVRLNQFYGLLDAAFPVSGMPSPTVSPVGMSKNESDIRLPSGELVVRRTTAVGHRLEAVGNEQ